MPNGNIFASVVKLVSPGTEGNIAIHRIAFTAYCVHSLLIAIALNLSDILPIRESAGFINPAIAGSPLLIEKLIKWDAHWYTYIAEHGYDIQSIVFFPVTVLLIKGLALSGLSYAAAGLIICNTFTFLSYYMMAKTFLLDFSEIHTRRALMLYAVMPTSFFLNSVYTESIFLVFLFACIYSARRKKWWQAGIYAALAALTRNLGILLTLFLLYEMFKFYKKEHKIRLDMLSLFLPLSALGAFSIYNYTLFGNFFAFIDSQQAWGRRFGLPWDNIWNNLCLITSGVPVTEVGVYFDIILVTLSLAALIATSVIPKIRIRISYLLLGWALLLVPLFSTSPIYPLYSMARFSLIVFPLYLTLARLPGKWFAGFIVISSLGLTLCTAWFINWYWLG